MTIEITTTLNKEELAKATALLQRLEWRSSNIAGGLRNVGRALLKTQNARFHSESDPDDKPWAKLSAATLAKRKGGKPTILRLSGDMMKSGSAQVSGTTLRVGVDTKYAAAQQFGATIHVKKKDGSKGEEKFTIPSRPFVGFGPKDEKATRDVIEDWLNVPIGT